ncbi:amidohydrolase [Undibacterium sp.]|jgi:predicted amidohydrolase YtcJ|uniref:amidohydrolase n=1 Tax=Undibacterium sp. TaxID=1914977 RepID=UPI002C0501DF|nr:amidohydrolase [Undibacterium sp.]HTD05205.1 amidohydrolase [Undibacterium sp.]
MSNPKEHSAARQKIAAVFGVAFLALGLSGSGWAESVKPAAADLILYNAKIWTVDDSKPQAEAVAIRGSQIVKVGNSRDIMALKGPSTKVMDMEGKLVLPGFNDAHTHLGNAAEWVFQARLTDVNDQKLMQKRIEEVTARVPKGMWITGGDWGTSAANSARKESKTDFKALVPDLKAIDAVTPDHPLLFRRYDLTYFANSKALKMSRLTKNSPDPAGGSYGRDPVTGELTGMLYGTAGEILERQLPPMSLRQKLIGARHVQASLNKVGITSITDIARFSDISEEHIYPFNVERSATDIKIFEALKQNGELNLRVYAIVPIETLKDLGERNITPGSGDEFLRVGALKIYGDSGIMMKPFKSGLPDEWSYRFAGEEEVAQEILDADKAGFDVGTHIIGDKASHLLIGWYGAAAAKNPPRDRRHRLIHFWHTNMDDIKEAARLGLTVDVQPYHLIREMAAMDKGLDEERAGSAHAWHSEIAAGLHVNLSSDLPGSYNKLHLAPFNPMENIYYAVTRSDIHGLPIGGWHPEQRMTIKEAIRAYTQNPAWSSHEEDIKGSITEGKLADLVVLSKDIMTVPPRELLGTEVLYTVLGGKIVYNKK